MDAPEEETIVMNKNNLSFKHKSVRCSVKGKGKTFSLETSLYNLKLNSNNSEKLQYRPGITNIKWCLF